MCLPKTQTTLVLIFVLAIIFHSSQAQNSPQDYLDAHNAARFQVGVETLTWDDEVAIYAENYANQHIIDCNMVYSGDLYGENHAKGFPDMTGKGAVDLWVGEKSDYDYKSGKCVNGGVCDHYTQVVWRNSKRIGCARVRCNDGWWLVVCNYDPPGNILHELPFFAKFRILNNCNHTIWPAITSTSQSQVASPSGFVLQPDQFHTVHAPFSWSGRIWGRTECTDGSYSSQTFTCLTGDCGSGKIECSGGSSPRATTVAEISLDGAAGNDSYDVSLVHGFNLPVLVLPQGGGGDGSNCSMTGCEADVNSACPPELAVKGRDGEAVACNSACDAFNTTAYCCANSTSETCGPTKYSRLFKRACPRAYSYQSDVATSTFTCSGEDYDFIFCPSPNTTSFFRFNDSGTEVRPSLSCTSYNCSGTSGTHSPHCPSFNCNGLNVGYPFWQQDNTSLSQYCGYPGFGLNCSRTVGPTFQLLNSSIFYIQSVNYSDNILTMGDIDVLNQSCPRARHNLTLNNLPLYPSSSSLNLSFYFNCSSPLSFASSIACLASSSKQSFVSLMSSRPENFSWTDYCEDNVVVTVMDRAVDVNNLNNTYQRGINQGFMLNWQPSLECRACEKFDGSCGFDRRAQKFLCFCNDGNTTTGQCSGSMTHNQPNQAWKIGIGIGAALFVVLLSGCVIFYVYRRKKDSSSASGTFWKWKTGDNDKVEAFILQYGASAPKRYRYSDVKKMTNSFKDELGKGGYGKVFKGKLTADCLVAVKVLNASKGNGEDFMNEVASIGRTSHVNIVTLLGFCYEGRKRALIYEFMPNGSLDKFIYGNDTEEPSQHLGVEKLYEIALGIARGLEYLHRGCNTRILHFDIKPHNVLLDEDFCPKLADFGLAKLYPKKKSKVTMSGTRGTIGYIAPEVFNRNLGGVSDKSDVYSYGMMVIEIVGGRNNNNNAEAVRSSEMYFPNWIYKRLEQDEDLQLQQQVVPMTMVENEIARKMMLVGLWCIQTDPSQRPSINKVIEMLEGSFEALEVPPRPFFSSPSRSRTNNDPSPNTRSIT